MTRHFIIAVTLFSCGTSLRSAPPKLPSTFGDDCHAVVARYSEARGARERRKLEANPHELDVPYQRETEVPTGLQDELAQCAKKVHNDAQLILVPGPNVKTLPWGLHLRSLLVMQMALSRGRSPAPPVAAPFNALALAHGGNADIVFAEALAPIDVWSASADGRLVATVHHIGERYAGASIPFYLRASWVSVVDLATLNVATMRLDTESEWQAVSLAWSPDGLWVRLRETRGNEDEQMLYVCAPRSGECRPEPAERFPAERGYAEATASGGYRIEPVPSDFTLPSNGDRRSIRVSPSGGAVAWVSETIEDAEELRFARVLYVRRQGEDIEVARGEGKLQAVWIDDDNLLFEPDPEMTDLWRERYSEDPGSDVAQELATLRGFPEGTESGDLQHERVVVFNLPDQAYTRYLDEKHVRLFAQPRGPSLRGRDDAIEVLPVENAAHR